MNTHRKSTNASRWLAATLIALCVGPLRLMAQAPAQEQPAPQQAQPGVIIKKESRLVLVDAVVFSNLERKRLRSRMYSITAGIIEIRTITITTAEKFFFTISKPPKK